ncbi:hypothetical protein NQ117_17875 [Paenibacillus sp. SC116]|uniref:hypothetical protein n=1 Tax=Paenibacillus sp. SC116 TaxID=2968986 RepID=UPI00215AA908|nr:hypothetical protein [Paenibacillus sp. SC116]MCR8845554.1 hypothetical protein [Paenibacillus sp. SC116]
MSSRHDCYPQVKPIVCPPIKQINNCYQPQVVPVIHPVEIINKVHTVPIPKHIWTYNETTVGGATLPPGPGFPNGGFPNGGYPGPGVGGIGTGCNPNPCCGYRRKRR